MDTTTHLQTTPEDTLPQQRSCSRCDGMQHLVTGAHGMGKYRCDRCDMVVGFDLEGDPREFLLDRGQPGAYTLDVFGAQLTGPERRL